MLSTSGPLISSIYTPLQPTIFEMQGAIQRNNSLISVRTKASNKSVTGSLSKSGKVRIVEKVEGLLVKIRGISVIT